MCDPLEMKPVEFEIFVQRFLEKQGQPLKDFRVQHLEKIQGSDGDYIIDVTARFEALGADFLVLIECKRQASDPVEREQVQTLNQKKLSVGAHKAMLFATAPFRSGALNFAKAHGIALVQVTVNEVDYVVKSWFQSFEAHVVTPHSTSLIEYLFDGQIPEPQSHPQSEQVSLQAWKVSVLKERLDYLRIISAKGYDVDEEEIESLRAAITGEEVKLEQMRESEAQQARTANTVDRDAS